MCFQMTFYQHNVTYIIDLHYLLHNNYDEDINGMPLYQNQYFIKYALHYSIQLISRAQPGSDHPSLYICQLLAL